MKITKHAIKMAKARLGIHRNHLEGFALRKWISGDIVPEEWESLICRPGFAYRRHEDYYLVYRPYPLKLVNIVGPMTDRYTTRNSIVRREYPLKEDDCS